MFPMDKEEGVGEYFLVAKTKDRNRWCPFQMQKIFWKDIPAALLIYKNRDPVIPGNLKDGI